MSNLSGYLPAEPNDGFDVAQPVALLIAERDAGAAKAALATAGYRVRAVIGLVEGAALLHEPGGVDLIAIEAIDAAEAALEPILVGADAAARARGTAAVVAVGAAQLDMAAALLTAPRTQLLCAPSDAERLVALAYARLAAGVRLTDVTRDGEAVRLRRLNEEVARIADALVRLTRGEDEVVRAPPNEYRGPEGETPAPTAAEVRSAIRARRLRAQFFEGDLFADPAWDMLLDLFAAHLERRRVSVSSLCIAAAVPPTTALRWIGTLHEYGLFERQADQSDRRRAYIGLSAKGLDGMRAYAAALRRAGLHLV